MNYGWTLEKESWGRLISAFDNRNWRKVQFSILEKGQIPTKHGVYVFCAKPRTNYANGSPPRDLMRTLLNAVYVGQAINLRQRFDDHWRIPMPPMRAVRTCFATTLEFWFTITDSPEELDHLESILIECFGPAANRRSGSIKGRIGEGHPA